MSKAALITGSQGQDGRLLSKYLEGLGYVVYRGQRRFSEQNTFGSIYLDLAKYDSIEKAIRRVDPTEIYNLGARSFVPTSWNRPDETFDVNTGGLARILEIVERYNPKIKVYQASSSEMYGNCSGFLNEDSPMVPTSPYAASKLAAHRLCNVYRQKGLFICGGICFNHESEYRGQEMVTRKITMQVGRWANGSLEPLKLGSLEPMRDWGYAGDYVKEMHAMLQLSEPHDYVIATGEIHSVKEFIDTACEIANVEPIIEFDERFSRSGEIYELRGDYQRAKQSFGYEPKTSFRDLVKKMVESDIQLMKAD